MSQCLNQKSDAGLSFSLRDLFLGLGIASLPFEFLLIPVDYLLSFKKNTIDSILRCCRTSLSNSFLFSKNEVKVPS